MGCHIAYAPKLDGDEVLACFEQRLAIVRTWQLFQERYPIIILPGSPSRLCVPKTLSGLMA
jgi:amidase